MGGYLGIDVTYVDPLAHLPKSSRKAGHAAEEAEGLKFKKLQQSHVNGKLGSLAVIPAGSELSGGLGKGMTKLLRLLAAAEIVGEDDNPDVKKRRALWMAYQRRAHCFALVKGKAWLIRLKHNMVRVALFSRTSPNSLDGLDSFDDPFPANPPGWDSTSINIDPVRFGHHRGIAPYDDVAHEAVGVGG